ncbi:hypothetical protein Trydic_g1424 [Trypoxylus dichotomus]
MHADGCNIMGKVALITGGLGAIGVSYAKHLISHGIKAVVLADNDPKANVKETIEKIERHGKGDVSFVKADVSIEGQLRHAFETTAKEFGHLDIFINNAGILDESHWKKMIRTNLTASIAANLMAMRKYLPKYRNDKEATIVNTICMSGLQPLQSLAIYSSTKSGLFGLHKALSHPHWFSIYGCRFLAICPGLTRTPMLKIMASKGVDLDLFDEECCEFPQQDVEHCGACLIDAVKNGKNGSIWICEKEMHKAQSITELRQVYQNITGNHLGNWLREYVKELGYWQSPHDWKLEY